MRFEFSNQDGKDHFKAEDLKQSGEKYKILFNSMDDAVVVYELPRNDGYVGNFIEVNDMACKKLGYTRKELLNLTLSDIYDVIDDAIINKLKIREHILFEVMNITKDGKRIPVEIGAHLFRYNEKPLVLFVARDISARKKLEKNIKYLSEHDALTGLYNRTYFENLIKSSSDNNLVLKGLIICDINELKITNDTMGHQVGDILIVSSSKMLKECTGDNGIVCRIGGDEFAIVISETSKNTVQDIYSKIKERIKEYNKQNPIVPISIAVGFCSNFNRITDLNELIRRADDNMYREKLRFKHESNTFEMLKCFIGKCQNKDDYLDQVQRVITSFAGHLKLSESHITDLRMLAKFYDIGKTTIDDDILLKRDKLNDVEWSEIRRHPEIGSRIYKALFDSMPMPDWILKHHEWWNGQGYPLRIKGNEIPLESRILAIVDAYTAMTTDRPYRPAMTTREAIAELKKEAGKQFDPNLVKQFTLMVENKGKN